jgi:cell division protein FtsB
MLGGNHYSRTYGAPTAELRPDFFIDQIKDEVASRDAGREIWREIERVRIIIPGAVASIVVKNVDNSHRERWKAEYEAFKAGREAPVSGTALEAWPILSRAQISELRYLQIRTVEELANLSDLQVQHIGKGGMRLRELAGAYLDEAAHEALVTKVTAENDVLRSQIAALQTQVNELGQQMLGMLHQQQRREVETAQPFPTYLPGQENTFAERRPFQGTLVEPPAVPSSLDTMANLPPVVRRHPRTDPNFDPAAIGGDEAVA